MPDTPEITEMVDFEAERLDGVLTGANGVPFLVVKAMDGMSSPIAEDDDSGTPGSPEWEAADAENLRGAASALAAVRDKIAAAADRECDEVEAGAEDSYSDVFDLQDALYALDAALGIVARLSFTEAQESEAVAKSVASIRSTLALLGDITTSPQEADMTPEEITAITAIAEAAVAKALAELAELAEVETPEVEAAEPAADEVAKSETPAEDEAAEPVADEVAKSEEVEEGFVIEPAPAAEVAEEVAKSDAEAPAEAEAPAVAAEVAKSDVEVLKSVVTEVLEGLLGDKLSTLEERLETVEKSPAPGGPLLNGAGAPSYFASRGSASDVDPEIERVSKALETEVDPARRAMLARDLGIRQMTAAYSGATRPATLAD